MANDNLVGLILYTIELDGCLNGVYTNNKADGLVSNEIAKRKDTYTITDEDAISGNYDSVYIISSNSISHVNLRIGIENGTKRTYLFDWIENGKSIFNGRGYKINDRQIIVHYWKV